LESSFQGFAEGENRVEEVYFIGDTFKGFSGKFNQQVLEELGKDGAVVMIEEDKVVNVLASQKNPPSWGLARLSQRQRKGFRTYSYPDSAG
jgi:hypothetical protein